MVVRDGLFLMGELRDIDVSAIWKLLICVVFVKWF